MKPVHTATAKDGLELVTKFGSCFGWAYRDEVRKKSALGKALVTLHEKRLEKNRARRKNAG